MVKKRKIDLLKGLMRLSIGKRLKLVISVSIGTVLIIMGLSLYFYQRSILLKQAEQNCYSTIDDLIRFTQNEIDASADKIDDYAHVATYFLQSQGERRTSKSETVAYKLRLPGTETDTTLQVPALYQGNLRLQSDTTVVEALRNMGISYFVYYQKVDSLFIEIINSDNMWGLKNYETRAELPSNDEWGWKLGNTAPHKRSLWVNRWVQATRVNIMDGAEIAAIILVGIDERNEDKLRKTFNEKVFYQTGKCYQLNDKGWLTFHPERADGWMTSDTACQAIIAEKHADPQHIALRDSTGTKKHYFYKYVDSTWNNIVIEIPDSELFHSLYVMRNVIFIGTVLLVGLIFLFITYISNSITSRLNKAVYLAQSISKGNLTETIPIDSQDEVAELSQALNEMTTILNNTVHQIYRTVDTIDTTSKELIDISRNIADGANNQASALEEISASMEELTSTTEQNTSNARETESISNNSAANIAKSSEVLYESVTYMKEISNKISLINDIAFQTNILSLNAAVEAARAGEYGRGFSVVAAEVKKLAEISREAADDIGKVSKKGMQIANEAGSKLAQHVPMVQRTAELVKNITVASVEQNSGIEQINSTIQSLNTVTQRNAMEANRIADNIALLSSNSKTLNQLIAFFKINIHK